MKYLYLLSQTERTDQCYSHCLVCAESEDEARMIMPDTHISFAHPFGQWASDPSLVKAQYLGIADEAIAIGVIYTCWENQA